MRNWYMQESAVRLDEKVNGVAFVQCTIEGGVIGDDCLLVDCLIKDGVTIGSECVLDFCEVEDNVTFGNDCDFKNVRAFGKGCIFGDGCVLPMDVSLHRATLGKSCKFGKYATLVHCVLGEACAVGSSSELHECEFGKDCTFGYMTGLWSCKDHLGFVYDEVCGREVE